MFFRPEFSDRRHAGRLLAERLREHARQPDTLVLALPRGGVPVAFEVARALELPLDVFVVRKLGVPGHEELAMGAIASGGVRVLNPEVTGRIRASERIVGRVAERERAELERRERRYRYGRPPPRVEGKVVILIDDGLATGSTMRAAVTALRAQNPARIVVAVPTAARATCAALRNLADEVVCLATPEPFMAVGQSYRHFGQTSDEEVRDLLRRAPPPDSPPETPESRPDTPDTRPGTPGSRPDADLGHGDGATAPAGPATRSGA
jgi:putative phosphoribosyl transferase